MIESTLQFCSQMQTDEGHFPTMADEDKNKAHCNVSFCHGASGAISPFLSAALLYEKLGNEEKAAEYVGVALNAGEAVWSKGLLLKGNGLCHGITGNGYFLHSIARWYRLQENETESQKWEKRALLFCKASSDYGVQ